MTALAAPSPPASEPVGELASVPVEVPGDTRRRRLVLVLLGVLVAAWCAAGTGVPATRLAQLTADEPQYVLSAISLAEDRDLDIADELADQRWRSFHRPDLPLQTRVLDGGHQLSPHDPLLPVLLAVPVALGGWVGAKLALASIAGALAVALAWTAHHRARVPFRLAVAGAAVFAMSPPLAVYATQVYPEVPAALAAVIAVAAITGPPTRRVVVVATAATVALPWLSVKYVPVAAALALVAAVRLWRNGQTRRLVAVAGSLVAAAVAYAVVHRLLYGGWTVYAAGDHFVAGESTVMGHDPHWLGRSRRLTGLLFDRDFGLVPWQPAFLLAVPAVAALLAAARSHARPRPDTAALAVPLAAGWLVATFAALTMHGWWWPGRQVVVVLPLLVVAVLWWATGSRARAAAVLGVGALGVVTFGWLVVEGLAGDGNWVIDFAATGDPLYRWWRSLLPDGRSTAAGAVARHAVWTGLTLVAAAGAAWWQLHRAGAESRH